MSRRAGGGLATWFVRACTAPLLHGAAPHVRRFVEQGLCRIRWIAGPALPLFLVGWWAHTNYLIEYFRPAIEHTGLPPASAIHLLISLPMAIGFLSALLVLVVPRSPVPVRTARRVVFAGMLGVFACEGLQLGFTHGAATYMTGFVLVTLLLFTLAPLSVRQQILAAAWALAAPLLGAAVTGISPTGLLVLLIYLTLPLGAAAFGILLHNWDFRNFRQRTLAELRLRRRTQEVERQKAEALQQRELAEDRSEEAERQRLRAMHLLASALTAPVAKAYERDGQVKPFTQTVVVIFCDAVRFSSVCRNLQPERVVSEMRRLWMEFDRACLELGVEPLRAEGDARMAVAGLDFDGDGVHTHRAAIAATLAMLRFRTILPPADGQASDGNAVLWPMRIGIDIGTVTAGVIDTNFGQGKYMDASEWNQYGRLWFDVWGDTVNVAARLAQHAQPNQILVRERLLWETGGLFEHGPIHSGQVKHDTLPDCAEVLAIKPAYRDADGGPSAAFWEIFHADEYRPVRPG